MYGPSAAYPVHVLSLAEAQPSYDAATRTVAVQVGTSLAQSSTSEHCGCCDGMLPGRWAVDTLHSGAATSRTLTSGCMRCRPAYSMARVPTVPALSKQQHMRAPAPPHTAVDVATGTLAPTCFLETCRGVRAQALSRSSPQACPATVPESARSCSSDAGDPAGCDSFIHVPRAKRKQSAPLRT